MTGGVELRRGGAVAVEEEVEEEGMAAVVVVEAIMLGLERETETTRVLVDRSGLLTNQIGIWAHRCIQRGTCFACLLWPAQKRGVVHGFVQFSEACRLRGFHQVRVRSGLLGAFFVYPSQTAAGGQAGGPVHFYVCWLGRRFRALLLWKLTA